MSESRTSPNPIICDICTISFTWSKNLIKHNRSFHPERVVETRKYTCTLCNNKFRKIEEFQDHLALDHPESFKLNRDTLIFYTENDFKEWKRSIEKSTFSSYILVWSRKSDDGESKYYTCHRNGRYSYRQKKPSERLRRLKHIGSNKINSTCPSNMKVVITHHYEACEIIVTYQSTHFGHELEVKRLPIHQEERIWLAKKMEEGVPVAKILTDIKERYPKQLTRHDLLNIRRDFNVKSYVVFNKDYAGAIDALVKKLKKGNAVILYKPFEETLQDYPFISKNDYLLVTMTDVQFKLLQNFGKNGIMMDSSHDTSYCGFQLSTLMVIDENEQLFPCALFFTTKESTEAYIAFFNEIKKRCPDLKPKFFMSDGTAVFYDAWKAVFSDDSLYFICSYHIRKTFCRHWCTKIKAAEMKHSVKKDLYALQYERDERTFHSLMAKFIDTYSSLEETKVFIDFFQKHYVDNAESWALCFKLKAGLSKHIKLERWHLQFKDDICKSKGAKKRNSKKPDKSLTLALYALGKQSMKKFRVLEGPDLLKKISEIGNRHEKAKNMSSYQIVENKRGKEWAFHKTAENIYTIERNDKCDCYIKCYECSICVHEFICSCIDFCVNNVLCKHIHAVCMLFLLNASAPPLAIGCDFYQSDTLEIDNDTGSNDSYMVDQCEKMDQTDSEPIVIKFTPSEIDSSIDINLMKACALREFESLLDSVDSLGQLKIIQEFMKTAKTKMNVIK